MPYQKILPKRDLYIDAGEGIHWVPLFPLVVAKNCPNCKTRETYFLDKWNRNKNIAYLKSFERGHEEATNDIVQHMGAWLDAAPKTTG